MEEQSEVKSPPLTQEERAQKKLELIENYKEEEEILTLQLKNETLKAEIEEQTARRWIARYKVMSIAAPPPQQPEAMPSDQAPSNNHQIVPPGERKLRKEKV